MASLLQRLRAHSCIFLYETHSLVIHSPLHWNASYGNLLTRTPISSMRSRSRRQQRHMQIHCRYNSYLVRWMVTQLCLQPAPARNLHGRQTAILSCIAPEQATRCSISPHTPHLRFPSMQTASLIGRLMADFYCSMVQIPWSWCNLHGNN